MHKEAWKGHNYPEPVGEVLEVWDPYKGTEHEGLMVGKFYEHLGRGLSFSKPYYQEPEATNEIVRSVKFQIDWRCPVCRGPTDNRCRPEGKLVFVAPCDICNPPPPEEPKTPKQPKPPKQKQFRNKDGTPKDPDEQKA